MHDRTLDRLGAKFGESTAYVDPTDDVDLAMASSPAAERVRRSRSSCVAGTVGTTSRSIPEGFAETVSAPKSATDSALSGAAGGTGAASVLSGAGTGGAGGAAATGATRADATDAVRVGATDAVRVGATGTCGAAGAADG